MGGISSAQAAQMLQGLSGSLDLTISAIPASSGSSPGYSINAIPTSGSTQLINVPIPTVNGKSTGGIDFQTGKYISTATIPVIYSYEDNGVATPTGFQGANGQLSNTYTETINGASYTFIIDNGNIEYAPTGSQAYAQLEFNANPNPQNAIALANLDASQASQQPTTASSETPLQGIESWLSQNVINPVEATLAPAGKAIENYVINPAESDFNNYIAKPFEQNVAQPVEQFGQDVLNAPLPSIVSQNPLVEALLPQSLQPFAQNQQNFQFLPSTLQLQQPTTLGELLSSAGTSASSFINNDVDKPIYNFLKNTATPEAYNFWTNTLGLPTNMNQLEHNLGADLRGIPGLREWWWNTYGSPNAQLQNALFNQIILAKQQSLMNQANQNPFTLQLPTGNPSTTETFVDPGLTLSSIEAYALGVPGLAQNLLAGANQFLGKTNQWLTGNPYTQYIPFNPTANIILNGVPQQEQTLNSAINAGMNATNITLPNGKTINPLWIPEEAGKYLFVNAPEALTNAAFGLANPQTTPLQYGLDVASLGSSAIMPGKAAMYGLGSGAINMGANWLLGGRQTPKQAFQSGYQFGAATAPLFEGAQLLGEAAQKFLTPTAREILFMASQTTDPAEQETLLKTLQLVTDHPQLAGMARYLLRTMPVNSVFGALQAGQAYLGGVRNPSKLLTSFGLGYGFGAGLEFVGNFWAASPNSCAPSKNGAVAAPN